MRISDWSSDVCSSDLPMNAAVPVITPRYLRTPDAATHLGLSPRTLEKHRCYGTGPVYRRLGGRVVYAIDDLDVWATRGTRRSTSDPGIGIVYPAKRRPAEEIGRAHV